MTNSMNLDKAKEILELNIKEVGSKMPPDVLAALKIAVANMKETIRKAELEEN